MKALARLRSNWVVVAGDIAEQMHDLVDALNQVGLLDVMAEKGDEQR